MNEVKKKFLDLYIEDLSKESDDPDTIQMNAMNALGIINYYEDMVDKEFGNLSDLVSFLGKSSISDGTSLSETLPFKNLAKRLGL